MLAVLVQSAALACAQIPQPAVIAPDTPVLPGNAPDVRVVGAPPGLLVTVETMRADYWQPELLDRSRAIFRADRCGEVRLFQVPEGGDWADADPRAFLYSMVPVKGSDAAGRPPSQVTVTADWGQPGVDAAGGFAFATAAGLPEVALGPDFPGAALIHPSPGERRPAIVLLGGSEGGSSGARSSVDKFVTRGFAVVVLPYYQPGWSSEPKIGDLPTAFADIPLDKLEGVIAWLKARPDVGKVGVYGVSKGAEFALSAATRMDGIAAVAAIVPTDVNWEGWGPGTKDGQSSSFSWRGEPLPFVPYEGMSETLAALGRGKPATMRTPHDAGRAVHPAAIPDARIPVERIDAPVLVAGGDADRTWASGPMVRAIAATRRAAARSVVALDFPDAGHRLSPTGDVPSDAADAKAQSVVWAATLRFFNQALRD